MKPFTEWQWMKDESTHSYVLLLSFSVITLNKIWLWLNHIPANLSQGEKKKRRFILPPQQAFDNDAMALTIVVESLNAF